MIVFKWVLGLVLQAFATAFFDWLRQRQDSAADKREGRAEAVAEAADIHAQAVDRMARVPLPGDQEAIDILRKGEA